jgi:hypothetical protein
MKMRFQLNLFLLSVLLLTMSGFSPAQATDAEPAAVQMHLPLLKGSPAEKPTSIQLIDQARQAGRLDDETALLYKVQAVMGDPALPAEYHGEDGDQDGTSVMNEAMERLDSLSPATQSILQPYLRAPSEPDSWIALHEPAPGASAAGVNVLTWSTLSAAGGKAKVWYHPEYPADGVRAQKIVAELDRHIWPKLTAFFREPLPDCGAACPAGGGDPSVDIYIAHIERTYVLRHRVNPKGASAYMVLEPDVSYAIVAHEVMHLIQFAYPLVSFAQYDWIFESTAQWAMDFVYPAENQDPDYPIRHEEHLVGSWFLDDPNQSLEELNDMHEYGAYLYWFFLRSPETVRTVLQNMSMANSLENVNQASAGQFKATWPQFALHNWNQPPKEEYQQWDEFYKIAGGERNTIFGAIETPFQISVNHLAAQYDAFAFPDPEIRRVRVQLPLALRVIPTAHVWAILKINGQWRAPEDWTALTEKEFCRDNPDENVEELVLVTSNSEWQDRSHVLDPGEGKVITSLSCGCEEANAFQEWTGTASMSYSQAASDQDTSAEAARQAQLSFQLTRQPDTAFDRYRWEGNALPTGSTVSINDRVTTSGGGTFTWIGNEIFPSTNRIRLEIDPATCRYEVWVGVFVDATYNSGTGEQQEVMLMEFRVYEEPMPENTTDWVITGSRSVPTILGGGNEGVDRYLGFSSAMSDIERLVGAENLAHTSVTWRFTPIPPGE